MTRFSLVSRFCKALMPVLLLAIASAAQASTYYVGSFGTDAISEGTSPENPYQTIQYAIDQAADNGDTIFVLADTYTGSGNKELDFSGKNLTLEALPYYGTATKVTIDCQGSGYGFYFHNGESAAAIVDSFSIINGKNNIDGGAGAFIYSSNPTFIDCTFASCSTPSDGGAVYISYCSPTFTGTTFSKNSADSGGAVSMHYSSPTFTGTTFSSNAANTGGAVYMYSSSPTFTGTTFSKNAASAGGAVYQNDSSYPIYTHSKFTANKATTSGGAIYVSKGDGAYFNDTFTGNTAQFGGAIYNHTNCSSTYYGGTFSGNIASSNGGAFYNYDHIITTFFNTLISGNAAAYGGAVYNENYSTSGIVNVTITGNKATSKGGAFYNYNNSGGSLSYSILWGNKVDFSDDEIIDADSTSASYVDTTDIESGWSGNGFSILTIDPQFVSTTDLHLKSTSPLIDAGDSNGSSLTDHDGNPRVCNGYSDLGAYELALPTVKNDSYSMSANTTLTVSKTNGVLANDLANKGGTLSAILVTKPDFGTLTLHSDGSFTYKAPAGLISGTQYFTYKAKNSKGSSSLATVTIHIG